MKPKKPKVPTISSFLVKLFLIIIANIGAMTPTNIFITPVKKPKI